MSPLHRLALLLALLLAATAASGCAATGQDLVTFSVEARGAAETSIVQDEWTLALARAELGFGPLYLCATPFADSDVCPRAEAELLTTTTLDALEPGPVPLGEADAITGTVRSAMFDYGVGWLATERRPRAFEGAPEGRSAQIEARATRDETELLIEVALDVLPREAGASAVIGAPVPEHAITGGEVLTVEVDLLAAFRVVDLDAVAALDEDGDGTVVLAPGDPPYEALVIALTTAPPRFRWTER